MIKFEADSTLNVFPIKTTLLKLTAYFFININNFIQSFF